MIRVFIFGCLFLSSTAEAFQKIKVENYGQVKATISQNEMNRISVEGDRIMQIFGVEDKFETELDEVNGQVFIRPLTLGKEPLSLTIVTENGITQDLILTPKKGLSEVVLLQKSEALKDLEVKETRFTFESLPIHQRVLKLVKQLAGEGRIRGYARLENFNRSEYQRTPLSQNLQVRPIEIFKGREFTGIIADLESTSCLPYLAKPKEVYEAGDLAISFAETLLYPHVPVRIYIIRKTGRGV